MLEQKTVRTSAVAITSGTPVAPGNAVFIDGKITGRVRLLLQKGFVEFNFEVGPTILVDLAVTDFVLLSGDAAVSVLA